MIDYKLHLNKSKNELRLIEPSESVLHFTQHNVKLICFMDNLQISPEYRLTSSLSILYDFLKSV